MLRPGAAWAVATLSKILRQVSTLARHCMTALEPLREAEGDGIPRAGSRQQAGCAAGGPAPRWRQWPPHYRMAGDAHSTQPTRVVHQIRACLCACLGFFVPHTASPSGCQQIGCEQSLLYSGRVVVIHESRRQGTCSSLEFVCTLPVTTINCLP